MKKYKFLAMFFLTALIVFQTGSKINGQKLSGLNNYKIGLTSITQDKDLRFDTDNAILSVPKGNYYGLTASADFFFDTRLSNKILTGFYLATYLGGSNSFDNKQSTKDRWGLIAGLNFGFATVYKIDNLTNYAALKTYLQADLNRVSVIGIRIQPQLQLDSFVIEVGTLIPLLYAKERSVKMFDVSAMYMFKSVGLGLKFDSRSAVNRDGNKATANQIDLLIQFH
jgi:hypothetical protein